MYFKNEKHRQAFNNNKIRFTVRKEHRRTAERNQVTEEYRRKRIF